MRTYLFIYFCLSFSFNSMAQGCSAAPDTRPLPQLLYKNDDKLVVFSCKVVSSYIEESGKAYSIAEIKEIYFGKTNLKKVRLWTGSFAPILPPPFLRPQPQPKKQEIRKDYNMTYASTEEGVILSSGSEYWGIKMPIDSFYIIYSTNDTSYNQNYMWHSKELKQTPAIKKEIETLKKFTAIFKDKKSGDYIFKDSKNNIQATGAYKKGKLNGVWKQYNEKGNLVSWEDFRNDIYKLYYLSGNISTTTTKYEDSTVIENYVDRSYLQFFSRTVEIKNDTGKLEITSTYDKEGCINSQYNVLTVDRKPYPKVCHIGLHKEFYPNGTIMKVTEYQFNSDNKKAGIYQQFYPNGQIKLKAHIYLDRRVGCWTWYNEDGTFWAEWDYMDGKAPQ
jgi:antitoxin component YwqK of YwqJK toxin-antitoxin module